MGKMLQRRTWFSPVRTEREFSRKEHLWLRDHISDGEYLTAMYQIEQVRRLRQSRASSQAEMKASTAIDPTIEHQGVINNDQGK